MGWIGLKSTTSLVLGLILVSLGIIPILNRLNITTFSLPDFPETLLLIILIAGSIYLVIGGFMEVAMFPHVGWTSIFGGAAVAVLGILKIVGKYTAVSGLIEGTFMNVLLTIVGFLLFIGAFMF